jgi:hypothetical protein
MFEKEIDINGTKYTIKLFTNREKISDFPKAIGNADDAKADPAKSAYAIFKLGVVKIVKPDGLEVQNIDDAYIDYEPNFQAIIKEIMDYNSLNTDERKN